MARQAAFDDADRPDAEVPDHGVELDEEQASQGFKTGHMRWVLAIGLALACVAVGLVAAFHA
jgi:hypothetical protein